MIGAGPSGIAAAKHALEAGFHVAVFEASGALGGQWHTTAAHSAVWPACTRTRAGRVADPDGNAIVFAEPPDAG